MEPFPPLFCGFLYKTLLSSTESKMSVLYRRQCGTLVGAPPSKHNTGTSFLEWPRILKVTSGYSSPVSPATPGFCSNLFPFLVILFKCILLFAYIKKEKNGAESGVCKSLVIPVAEQQQEVMESRINNNGNKGVKAHGRAFITKMWGCRRKDGCCVSLSPALGGSG